MPRAPIVVYPPSDEGRRVRADGEAIGRARDERELREFLRRAGLPDWETADLTDPALVEWRGGGPEVWE
ncbi:hypothetical protein [Streptomyces sp. XC 2026]|uniref:hypothetical protein n=1 Tax=Streptomyces sp. XC 2026 TaxID=2782004 RepID=UPI0019060E2A|nr:hypothetical protein [Streptomyces sp. XC 2026]QQN79694.1 hypothetical protein IPZ77_21430 [Streptomyces sp. XC 2026]QQN80608.1 hypothetical protein IPZ77_26745 [Streptomyces sp. XC 2026]